MEGLTFSTATTAISMFALVAFIIGLIIFIKFRLRKASRSDLREKYKDKKWASPLVARSKYPDVNAFSLRGPILNFGIAGALLFTLLAFNWTTYEEQVFIPDDALMIDDEIEIEPPRTAEPPPPPPPPPPPVIEEVPEEEIMEEDEPEFVDQDVEEEDVFEIPEEVVEIAPPPPPPPPPPDEDEIFVVVEQMPRFPGCENESGTSKEKEACAQKKMLQYIYKNLKYPNIAKENGVEGRVVIQFVVDKKGKVSKVNIARDIGAGCGEAAKAVVESMNNLPQRWIPGKQRGRPVSVKYTLPVTFRLEN